MGDVIDFPSRTVQRWADIERTIRRIFSDAAVSAEMQDEVLGQMKDVFQRYSVTLTVPLELPGNLTEDQRESVADSVGRAFADHERQLHDFTNHILLERLQIEIELYRLRHDKGDNRT